MKARPIPPVVTALEVAIIFACMLEYIWRWQRSYPHSWILVLSLVLLTHLLHSDTVKSLGLGVEGLRQGAAWLLPLALVFYVPLLLFGIYRHELAWLRPTWASLEMLLGYGMWCAFQQYLAQSYFHNRLALIVPNRHFRSILVGSLFGAAHIPNPILTVATFIAGVLFAESFARHRNIWPLALAQAVGGLLLAAVIPDAWIHHMRVGPGFLFYGIR